MALTKKGTLKFGFGTGGVTAPTVTGIDTPTSSDTTSEYVVNTTAKNSDGEVAGHVFGSTKNTIKVEGFTTAGTLPTLGQPITAGAINAFAQSVSISASHEDFVKVSVSAEGHAGAQA